MRIPLPAAAYENEAADAPSNLPNKRQARFCEAFLLLFVLLVLFVGAWQVVLAKSEQAPVTKSVVNINTATAAQIANVLQVPVSAGKQLVLNRAAQKTKTWADVDALGRVPLVPKASRAHAAQKLQAAQMPTPREATRPLLHKALPDLNPAALDRILILRDSLPAPAKNARPVTWEKFLAAPLISPQTLGNAQSQMVVRTWPDAARTFWICAGALGGFLVLAHLCIRWFRPLADPFLLPIAGLLSVFGLLLLFALKDPVRDMPSFLEQTKGLVAGGTIALFLALSTPFARLPLHRYGYVYALAAVGGTFLLGIAGAGPGGVRLSVAGAQPVEIIKILLVFFLAAYLAERGPLLLDPLKKIGPLALPRKNDVLPLLVLYVLPLVLFALVKDLGPVLLLFGAFLLLVYLATGRGIAVVLGIVALGIGGFVGYKLRFGVFETRVDMWMSPWNNLHKSGDHLVLGLWGLASGGGMGSGLGLGGTRFIPRGGSDSAFAAWGEETGLFGTLLICVCFFVIAHRGLRIARRASTDFDRFLASGLSGLLGLQAVVIMAGNLGVLPLTGITLPLISYGKSSLVASFFTVGVLLMLSVRASGNGSGETTETQTFLSAPSTVYQTASRRVWVFFLLCLGVVIPIRLFWVQELASVEIASRTVRVPDADNIARSHTNPRLLLLTNQVEKGRFLDRNGRVLAETKNGKRTYPYGAATAHLIGYADPAIGGPVGLEKQFANKLRGFDTTGDLVGYWRRKDLPGFALPKGQDVTLTIDAELQKAVLDALTNGAASVRDKRTRRPKNRGAMVVLDVQTGGVLASVSLPTFNPENLKPPGMRTLSANLNGDSPLLNRATSGFYPPGSTFKIVTAAGLLHNNKADLTVDCNHVATNIHWTAGGKTFARRRIIDDEGDAAHGATDLTRAVAQSCNVYFGRAGIVLGPDLLRQNAETFGFSHLPPPAQWNAELPDLAYGQGPMLASPMEMAGVAQIVANSGIKQSPTFLLADTPAAQKILSPDEAARLSQMMRAVTQSGTASGRFSGLPYAVAGKTGTAQNGIGDKVAHSWFIGFAPADKPKIAFAVIVENGGYGASVAVPLARRVVQAALK